MKDKEKNKGIKTSIGGQALLEGIMMRGPKRTAMAVRDPDGEIVVEEWDTVVPNRPALTRWPFVRGIFNFVDSMKTGMKCLTRSAELSGLEELEEEAAREKEVIVEKAVITVGAAQPLFLGEGKRQEYGMIRFDAEPFDVSESYMRLMLEN